MKKNIAVVGSGVLRSLMFESYPDKKHLQVKKFFTGDEKQSGIDGNQFPDLEIVHDIRAIIEDEAIDTVLVCQRQLKFAGQIMSAGKMVRIV